MKYKTIIFDMDGTIVDTEEIWQQAGHSLITSRGKTLSDEDKQELAKRLSGFALHDSCKVIKDFAGLEEPIETLIREKSGKASDLYAQGIRFIEGFLDFHQKAVSYNLKVGIATNADNHTIYLTDKTLNLKKLFGNHIYSFTQVNNQAKPNPAVYLHAAQQLETDPQECIAIEDSHHGVQAARNAGMLCIGINTAKKPELLQNSNFIIDHYDEIRLEELLGIPLHTNKG